MTLTSGSLLRRQPASFYFSPHFIVSKHSNKQTISSMGYCCLEGMKHELFSCRVMDLKAPINTTREKGTIAPSTAPSRGPSVAQASSSRKSWQTEPWWQASSTQLSISNHSKTTLHKTLLPPAPRLPQYFCINFNQLAKRFSKLIFLRNIYFLRLHHCY